MYAMLRTIEIYWNEAVDHLFLPHIKHYQKSKRDLELVSASHFRYDFWRKLFFLLYSITWPNFIVWLHLLREILRNVCSVIVY